MCRDMVFNESVTCVVLPIPHRTCVSYEACSEMAFALCSSFFEHVQYNNHSSIYSTPMQLPYNMLTQHYLGSCCLAIYIYSDFSWCRAVCRICIHCFVAVTVMSSDQGHLTHCSPMNPLSSSCLCCTLPSHAFSRPGHLRFCVPMSILHLLSYID